MYSVMCASRTSIGENCSHTTKGQGGEGGGCTERQRWKKAAEVTHITHSAIHFMILSSRSFVNQRITAYCLMLFSGNGSVSEGRMRFDTIRSTDYTLTFGLDTLFMYMYRINSRVNLNGFMSELSKGPKILCPNGIPNRSAYTSN